MAYMTQSNKKRIAEKLKTVMPTGWKYSLAVRDRSKLVLTIQAAPVDILRAMAASEYFDPAVETHRELYGCRTDRVFTDAAIEGVFDSIRAALNDGNYDRSDTMTDYFDVGWYVDVKIGTWDRPFSVRPETHVTEA